VRICERPLSTASLFAPTADSNPPPNSGLAIAKSASLTQKLQRECVKVKARTARSYVFQTSYSPASSRGEFAQTATREEQQLVLYNMTCCHSSSGDLENAKICLRSTPPGRFFPLDGVGWTLVLLSLNLLPSRGTVSGLAGVSTHPWGPASSHLLLQRVGRRHRMWAGLRGSTCGPKQHQDGGGAAGPTRLSVCHSVCCQQPLKSLMRSLGWPMGDC
jgi:hypothetical protein